MRIIIFLGLCSAVLSANIPGEKEQRITAGLTARPGEFPYHASLRTWDNVHFCNGFIANNQWVVTVANCVHDRTIGNTFMALGALHRYIDGIRYDISEIVIHPQYEPDTFRNDIALLRESEVIIETEYIHSITLGSQYIRGGNIGLITSWGPTEFIPGTVFNPDSLKFRGIDTFNNYECVSLYGDQGKLIYDNKLCTEGFFGEICVPDAGSPVMDTSDDTVFSVLSWSSNCGAELPIVHERISSHRNWILSHIQN
ncbi:Peptidase S1 domain-containing protein [Sergentomyia squamirostris]